MIKLIYSDIVNIYFTQLVKLKKILIKFQTNFFYFIIYFENKFIKHIFFSHNYSF
jgi:hypothetical protein